MKNISLLFPDSVHFHARNFKSLFDFIKRNKIKHTFIEERNSWVAAFGDYSSFAEELSPYFDILKDKNEEELEVFKIDGINLFDVCRDEALTYYLPKKDFRNKINSFPNKKELINIMNEVDHDSLILNMCAAWSWCDFWKNTLNKVSNHTYVLIFSGAQIYNRALLEILKTHPSTPLVMEHFFTGNEYYLEEKYEPIPNNSDLKYENYFNSIRLDETSDELDRLRIKAINKVILSNNKNVKKSTFSEVLPAKNKDVITIIGQVVNDFSIICTANKYLSTISFYIEIIDSLLRETDSFVVFKAHPWERNKSNVKTALTYDELNEYVNNLPTELQERIYLTEDFNLYDLMRQSKHIVTLCSQSAIEAAFIGLKPIQFGDAFYGKKSFTYDYDDIDLFIEQYKHNKLNPYLTIEEYNSFEIFLVKTLEKKLISVFNSGILALERKLFLVPPIPLVKLEGSSEKQSQQKSREDVPVIPPKNPSKPKSVIKENKAVSAAPPTGNKKIAKFKKDPKRFFLDSKYKTLKFIGRVFY
ncbi:capsular polysaccharide export protein, LipB/KpsS family [Pseudocitrobacter cyperus]|uniref:Capsular biosynthesis protein n=1 Tax=Pseudocitrobacter cyperus TaxID=3112843 RepID=A0ABV0HI75_9ENTR